MLHTTTHVGTVTIEVGEFREMGIYCRMVVGMFTEAFGHVHEMCEHFHQRGRKLRQVSGMFPLNVLHFREVFENDIECVSLFRHVREFVRLLVGIIHNHSPPMQNDN